MSNTDRKAVIKNADMTDDMTQDAIDVANQVSHPPPPKPSSSNSKKFQNIRGKNLKSEKFNSLAKSRVLREHELTVQ